jgi:hypothetical protein
MCAALSPYRTSHLNRFGLFELKERHPMPIDYGVMPGLTHEIFLDNKYKN